MIKKRVLGLVTFVAVAAMIALSSSAYANVFGKQHQAEVNYGKGVHAFFDGDYQQAIELFQDIEKSGFNDPRACFFLALSHYRLEEKDKAEPLFKKAAELEISERRFRDYNVSDAIKRIQGKERLMLEEYRKEARTNWDAAEKRRDEVKYGNAKARDKEILSALSRPFVGTAPFGARSVDPFRKNTDEDHSKLIPSDDKMPPVEVTPLERRSTARQMTPTQKPRTETPSLTPPPAKKEVKVDVDNPFGLLEDDEKMPEPQEEKNEDDNEKPNDESDGNNPFA